MRGLGLLCGSGTLVDIKVHAILHRKSKGYLVCDLLARNQSEFIASEQKDDSNKSFKSSKVLTYVSHLVYTFRGNIIITYQGKYVDQHGKQAIVLVILYVIHLRE